MKFYINSEKKSWILTDCWELGYDFSCPNCSFTFFTNLKNSEKPKECPKCKEALNG